MNNSTVIQNRARRLVRDAILRKSLKRPNCCEDCGKIPKRALNGASCLHAHHYDYSKPLNVRWLCVKCHIKITPRAFGEKHHKAILSELKILACKDLNFLGWNFTDMGEMFQIDRTAISKAIRGVNWKARQPKGEV